MAAKKCLLLLRSFHGLPRNINFSSSPSCALPSISSSHAAAWYRQYSSSENPAAKAKPAETVTESASAMPAVDQAAFEKLRSELEESKKKYDELMDKYKRSLADSENMRVRLEKRVAEAKIFGIQSFGKDLLEVADTLQNATAAVPKTELENNKELKNLYDGLVMTQAALLQIFKRHGMEPMEPMNTKFDPNFHEALFMKVDKTVEPNTVIEVTKVGYKLHDRCIRPALVGVSKAA